MNYYSHIGQDKWVCETLNFIKQGTWVDVGCYHPVSMNNTYAMESQLGWKGLSIDIDQKAIEAWKHSGRNLDLVILADALTLDYEKLFLSAKLPSVIDYLTMDLEPPAATLQALYKMPFDKYKFKCITYETDAYRSTETEKPSRDYLTNQGYVLVVSSQARTEQGFTNGPVDDFWMHKDFVK